MIQIPNITSKAACFGCGACQAACPHRAITMVADGEGFVYPVVDAALCTECGLCSDVCPAAEKPVGLVYVAVDSDQYKEVLKLQIPSRSDDAREYIRYIASSHALYLIWKTAGLAD